jgi:hypothetical protein
MAGFLLATAAMTGSAAVLAETFYVNGLLCAS